MSFLSWLKGADEPPSKVLSGFIVEQELFNSDLHGKFIRLEQKLESLRAELDLWKANIRKKFFKGEETSENYKSGEPLAL